MGHCFRIFPLYCVLLSIHASHHARRWCVRHQRVLIIRTFPSQLPACFWKADLVSHLLPLHLLTVQRWQQPWRPFFLFALFVQGIIFQLVTGNLTLVCRKFYNRHFRLFRQRFFATVFVFSSRSIVQESARPLFFCLLRYTWRLLTVTACRVGAADTNC